jgi:hypothetical protein
MASNPANVVVDKPGAVFNGPVQLGGGTLDLTSGFTLPQLADFFGSDTIDLKDFEAAGATLNYNASTGVLQVANSADQVASLNFTGSTLGSGTFHDTSDGRPAS